MRGLRCRDAGFGYDASSRESPTRGSSPRLVPTLNKSTGVDVIPEMKGHRSALVLIDDIWAEGQRSARSGLRPGPGMQLAWLRKNTTRGQRSRTSREPLGVLRSAAHRDRGPSSLT
jgi:hypothetical protein